MSEDNSSNVASIAIVVIVFVAAVMLYLAFRDRGAKAEVDLPDVDIEVNEVIPPEGMFLARAAGSSFRLTGESGGVALRVNT